MSRAPEAAAKGRSAPVLVLCRHCIEYVFAGTELCPHCGRDAHDAGRRYREGGYQVIEAIQRIDDVLARRAGAPPRNVSPSDPEGL
jgi:hypothetical protein